MIVSIIVFIFLLIGGAVVFAINPIKLIKSIKSPQKKQKHETAKAYIQKLEGRKKENVFVRSRKKALSAYTYAGQEDKYKSTLRLSLVLSVGGFFIAILMRNFMLAPVLAIGLYFMPLWFSSFVTYRYNKRLVSELETALSMVTSAYIRHSDISKAVSENVAFINNPVKGVFEKFLYNVKYVNPNISAEIEKMKDKIGNIYFSKWCDNLILCQSDHTLKNSLLPIITELSEHKKSLMKNETAQMKPIKEAVTLICLVVGSIPLLWLINKEWFSYLTGTIYGQGSIAIAAIGVLLTVNKAIKLSQKTDF